ncbi:DNA polymerase III PolC-type [Pseudoclavibacter triregionum]|nr:DNA polymerase III PolC-type [Pseudoclavibacter triregionum]
MTELAPWTSRLAVFDTETTGVDPLEARIVTAFVGLIDENGEVERGTDWLADPGVEIPEQAAAVHGITTEMAREEGEPAAEVIAKVRASIEWIARNRVPLVVFNAPYDLTLLDAECRRHGMEPVSPLLGPQVVDPLVIDKAIDRYRKGKRTLVDQAAAYGVELLDAHSAADDAIAGGQVALAIARAFPDEVGQMPLEELHRRQAAWFDEQAADFEDYMRRQRDPAFSAPRGWPVRSA